MLLLLGSRRRRSTSSSCLLRLLPLLEVEFGTSSLPRFFPAAFESSDAGSEGVAFFDAFSSSRELRWSDNDDDRGKAGEGGVSTLTVFSAGGGEDVGGGGGEGVFAGCGKKKK